MANLLSTTLSGNNHITLGPNTTWSSYLRVGGNGHSVSGNEYASVVTTNGNLHLDAGTSRATYINHYAGTGGVAFGNGATGVSAWMGADGDLWKGDSDNSGTQYVYNSGTWAINVTGNAGSVTNGVYTTQSINNLTGVLNFGVNNATPYNNPTGTSNGISFGGIEASSLRQYGIFTEQENVGGNYSKLTLNYHTGIRLGASSSYGGTRFYNDAAGNGSSSVIFSVGNGDNHVRVNNNLYIGGNLAIHAGNIGSQSVSYASSAGTAGQVSGVSVSATEINRLKTTLGVTGLPYSCDIVVEGDPNTYYPVHFIWGDQDVWRRIIIKRGYGEQAPWDPIGTGSHHGGLLLDWEGNFGGWGGADYSDRLRVFQESYTTICADMYIFTHSMGYVFMLRGGGAVYHIFSDQNIRGYHQDGVPDIAYDTNFLFYDHSITAYRVYAPAPVTAINSSRIDGLRTKKQSLFDGRYQQISTAINTGNIGSQSVTYATTAGALTSMNISQFSNNSGYITGYSETDTLATVTGRGATTASQVSFTKTDDHAISVGTIRGRAVGSQTGEFIQLYERVNIGGPSGWGAANTSAPNYGLSVYGGATIGYGNSGGLAVTGTLSATNFSGSSSGTNTGDQTNISGNAATATSAGTVTGSSTINGYLTLNTNWGVSPYTSAFNIVGTYPSMTFRGSNGDTHYLIHMDSAGDIQYYFGPGYLTDNWTRRYEFTKGGNFSVLTGNISASGTVTASGGNSTQWNTAYGWGNHTSAGYLTSYSETDTLATVTGRGATTTSPITINGAAGYPLQISSSQRYQLQVRNINNTINAGYGWWWFVDTNQNMGFHADGAADRFTLTRDGNLTVTGSFTTTNINAPSGYVSNGNPWGTANSAYFPNGITTAGSDNWIYGHTYVGNAPGNGNGHEFWADGNMRSTGHHYLDANYGQTIVGKYSSTVYQGVWAMGDSYKLPMNGSTTGSLYGLAWSHPNAGGVAGNLNTHGLLVMENGTFLAAISGSIRSRDDMRAPIFYDSDDTGFYLDPNGTSNLNKFSERTMAFNDMNPKSINSPYVDRYNGSVGYRNGTMGYANTDFNTIARNWGSGFIDTWSSPANAPGGSTHYIGLQGVHYSDGGTSFYGFQMACAGEADNRFFWRSSWPSMRSWVEMIHSGNIGSQSVSNATTAGGLAVHTGRNNEANKIVRTQENGYVFFGYINSSNGNENNNSNPDRVWGTNGSDDYLRTYRTSALSVAYAASAGDSTNLGGLSSSRYVRNDIYNSVDAGLQVFRNIGSIDGSWPSSDHTLGLENSDAGNIVVNFHRAGYTSNNLWYNGSQFRFDTVVSSISDFRAPIFYDSADTGYSWNPNTTNAHRFSTPNGYVDIGPMNGGWCHFQTDRPRFYFGNSVTVDGDLQRYSDSALYIHSANYNSYAPTLTGGGASGSWGISVTGNAATATNVAWTGVTSRPTALSQFSNDLGNYGGWLTTGGKAADSELIDGIDSSRIVFGDGARASTYVSSMDDRDQKSGFFFKDNPTGQPFGDWWNWLTVAGNSWQSSNNYSFQISHAFHSDDAYIRRMTNGTAYGWRTLITSGNIGSQSVNYATSAGSATSSTTATTANRLERYGVIYGNNWNDYYLNNRFIVASAHNATGTNKPDGAYTYGSTLSYYNSGEDHYQIYVTENSVNSNGKDRKMYYRSGWNGSWGGWRSVVDVYNSVCYIDAAVTATGDITAFSDGRVKENVETLEGALDKTLKLRGVSYNRTDIEDKSTKIGVIAQEILEVVPEVVSQDENGMYAVSYGNITALLIEAIKEQQKQIDELKEIINGLTK